MRSGIAGQKARKRYKRTEKGIAAQKKYQNSAAHKAVMLKYLQSEKGKATRKKYATSARGKAIHLKCQNSEKGRASRRKYDKSDKGRDIAVRRNLRNYNLTLEQYNILLEKQSGVCAICGEKNMRGHRLSVDHDHNTRKVRGLLCNGCNLGVGNFKESVVRIINATKYLLEWQYPSVKEG